MYVEDWIKKNGQPKAIVTANEALWDTYDGEIREDWLLKRHITCIKGKTLTVK